MSISDKFWANIRTQHLEDAAKVHKHFAPYLRDSLMDFGCGDGSYLEHVRRNTDLRTVGIDVARNSWYPGDLVMYGGGYVPLQDGAVACSTANFVLHHTPDPEAALGEMLRVTKERVLLLEDMPVTPWQTFVLYFMHVVFDVFMIVLSWFSSFEWKTDFRYRFQSDAQWKAMFGRLGAKLVAEHDIKTEYPVPFKLYVLEPSS